MGQTSSTPSDRWPYFLIFTTDKYDLDNNTLTCEELGIRYRIYTPPVTRIFALTDDRVTSIYRWDSKAQREILIAEVEKRSHKQRMRIAPGTGLDAPGINVPFVPAKEYFPNTSGWSKPKRIFRASNGKEYIWRVYDGTLYPSDDKSEPIAKFGHAGVFRSTPMHIKLTNGCTDILDELVVTCLISENERIEQGSLSNEITAKVIRVDTIGQPPIYRCGPQCPPCWSGRSLRFTLEYVIVMWQSGWTGDTSMTGDFLASEVLTVL